MSQKIRNFLTGSPFMRHVLTLMSGTLLSQIIAIVTTWVCGRYLYTPLEYGQFGVFTALVNAVVTVAALRFDLTVMLAKNNAEALSIFKLATRCIVVFSLICSAVSAGLWPFWKWKYHSASLATWMAATGAVIAITSANILMNYWLNRQSKYKDMANNQVVKQAGISGSQLALGAIFGGAGSLIISQFIGLVPAYLQLRLKTKDARVPLPSDAPTLKEVAWRHRKMPLVNGPNVLIDALRLSAIQFIIASFATTALGYYNMASNLLQAPLMILTGAIAQVFFHRISKVKPGEITVLVKSLCVRMLLVGVPVFGLLFALGPWIFATILGQQWYAAGQFARALTPWLFMMLFTSPTSNVFLVVEKQQRLLIFAIIYTIVPITILLYSPYNLLKTVYLMSGAQAILLVLQMVSVFVTCWQYDRR